MLINKYKNIYLAYQVLKNKIYADVGETFSSAIENCLKSMTYSCTDCLGSGKVEIPEGLEGSKYVDCPHLPLK